MISARDITEAVVALGVEPTDTLFVHSGVRKALTVEGRSREEKLATIVAGLRGSVANGALLMPAFSYSFCRDEPFDLEQSRSDGVGVLSEHFRQQPGVRRTTDPLFSASTSGELPREWEERLFHVRDVDCFGEGSIFDFLHQTGAKFLFFGVPATANTFVHYIEQRLAVPYRYFKEFRGEVIDGNAKARVTARFYVRELESDVEVYLAPLADDLLLARQAAATVIPNGPSLYLTEARAVAAQAATGIGENPDYLLRRGHPGLTHLYPQLAP